MIARRFFRLMQSGILYFQYFLGVRRFDRGWYCATYRDVDRFSLGPLAHYVLFGRPEGRLPYLGAPVPFREQPESPDSVGFLRARLWGGFEHVALPRLQKMVAQGNAEAALALASWRFTEGSVKDADELLQRHMPTDDGWLKRSFLVGRAKCSAFLRDYPVSEALSEECRALPGFSYIEANGFPDAFSRVSVLNEIWRRCGLSEVHLLDGSPSSSVLSRLASSRDHNERTKDRSDQPMISVIIPVFNGKDTLSVALDSLLSQTWENIELIVVDDASVDGTQEIIERYQVLDSRIVFLRNNVNRGAYPTRNFGLSKARGAFVTVHDGDDWAHPQKLERQVQPLLDAPELQASCSYGIRVTSDLLFVGSWILTEGFLEQNASSWMVRRSVLEMTGPWDFVNVAADSEYATRLEHHIGHEAMIRVCESAPLSLNLTGEATLTRVGPTHIKTMFYGLRRVYREASQWWHRQERPPVLETERPFPVPLGIVRNAPLSFDVMYVADFSGPPRVIKSMIEALEKQASVNKRLCLLHWPNVDHWVGNAIDDRVFSFCQQHEVYFAHPGVSIQCVEVMLDDVALWNHPPSRTVILTGLERVVDRNGQTFPDAPSVRSYFAKGGVSC